MDDLLCNLSLTNRTDRPLTVRRQDVVVTCTNGKSYCGDTMWYLPIDKPLRQKLGWYPQLWTMRIPSGRRVRGQVMFWVERGAKPAAIGYAPPGPRTSNS